jgi:DNA ligase-1
LLAHKWESHVDVTGWWLSEKLDGVRAYWDGSQFLSRLGNRFFPPPWFVESLPKTPLDGELWGGRKLFQRTVGIVKRQDQSPLWRELHYVVFDAPAHPGLFEERMAHCESLVGGAGHPHARVHAQSRCEGIDHLRQELARVEGLGGEGLMARRPQSRYEVGRSNTLLKIKTFHDAEARVIGHAPGAGRHRGRVGALIVELADATRFNVGTGLSDKDREAPPPVGSLITFRYQELSDGGVPRFPSYVGVRLDARAPSTLVVSAPPAPPPAPPSASPSAPPQERAPGRVRTFELVDGASRKFWEIELCGASFTTRYGRIGSAVQKTLKEYTSEDEARREYEKLIGEKTRKGYAERTDESER